MKWWGFVSLVLAFSMLLVHVQNIEQLTIVGKTTAQAWLMFIAWMLWWSAWQ